MRSVGLTGDFKMRTQTDMLMEGVDLVVATPNRLLRHMDVGNIQLDRCKAVVLDEVDILLGEAQRCWVWFRGRVVVGWGGGGGRGLCWVGLGDGFGGGEGGGGVVQHTRVEWAGCRSELGSDHWMLAGMGIGGGGT